MTGHRGFDVHHEPVASWDVVEPPTSLAGACAAVIPASPEVVVHEMTDLKGASDLRHFDQAFAVSNRLRTEGTDHLFIAARAAGVRRYPAKSDDGKCR